MEQDQINHLCWCTTCRPLTTTDLRFVVCPECGNKRCPRAANHRYQCSGSNELNQVGRVTDAHVKEDM